MGRDVFTEGPKKRIVYVVHDRFEKSQYGATEMMINYKECEVSFFETGKFRYRLIDENTVGVCQNKSLYETKSKLTIPEKVTFSGKEYTVTSICSYAFYRCSKLSSIKLPDTITEIGEGAFDGCPLRSITLPKSLERIEHDAFSCCEKLTSVIIPDAVTNISCFAFSWCHNLQAFVTSPKNTAYCTVDGVLFSKDKTRLIIYPKGKLENSYIIPGSVTTIGDGAFMGCQKLT
jgi:hypothetical protein